MDDYESYHLKSEYEYHHMFPREIMSCWSCSPICWVTPRHLPSDLPAGPQARQRSLEAWRPSCGYCAGRKRVPWRRKTGGGVSINGIPKSWGFKGKSSSGRSGYTYIYIYGWWLAFVFLIWMI